MPVHFVAGSPDGTSTNIEVNLYGGRLSRTFSANAGSVVNFIDGEYSTSFMSFNAGSELLVSGGTSMFDDTGPRVNAYSGSRVEISGGAMRSSIYAMQDSRVTVFGGETAYVSAEANSEIEISGGMVFGLMAEPDSNVTIRGGNFGFAFMASAGSNVEFIGGEYKHNGTAFTETEISLSDGDLFTGVFADGSPFIFTSENSDALSGVKLTQHSLPPPDFNPILVDTANPSMVSGLRAGQSMTLGTGGVLNRNFAIVDASLDIDGGTLGKTSEAIGSTINLRSGRISEVFQAYEDSIINVSGGVVEQFFFAQPGSTVNISGGQISSAFFPAARSEINVTGLAFLVNGEPLPGLTPDLPFLLSKRNVNLSGILSDGTHFSFDLNADGQAPFQFSPDAKLTLALVAPLPGDYNADGVVDAADYSVWRDNRDAPAGTLPNDPSGEPIGAAQLVAWRANYGAGLSTPAAASVPEPGNLLAMLVVVGLGARLIRHRPTPA
ncbi:hypothetical protein Pla123a_04750 [Posidoniimonas polymericola]|uniref:PEP-CTERM protein-sorting domain-containing protein n=2 Tax=Posidoniimonas polymericola TaxID=2528002 RepID=A0A5C5ZET4_9BACT|nr:hypothetical protein Pla123a_04750 [Posidoniimonas polymericola]